MLTWAQMPIFHHSCLYSSVNSIVVVFMHVCMFDQLFFEGNVYSVKKNKFDHIFTFEDHILQTVSCSLCAFVEIET